MPEETVILQYSELKNITLMHIALAVLLIPTMTGFLMEMGRDFYRVLRKQDASGKCNEHVFINQLIKEMREKQVELRDEVLPNLNKTLASLDKQIGILNVRLGILVKKEEPDE